MKTLDRNRDLFPETLLCDQVQGHAFTTSLKVAEHFGKRHDNVLRAIARLISELPEGHGGGPIFGASSYRAELPNDRGGGLIFEASSYRSEQGKSKPMVLLSRNGFALLAMGFSGREALAWKLRFLAAFDAMEEQLLAPARREASALWRLRPRWQAVAHNPALSRERLRELTGHRSAGGITAARRRLRELGVLA